METVLRSATREIVIGPEQPFCIIGERINPTGRKIFQEQLRGGDLSRIEIDVAQQVAGGAMVLDVNMGAPLADEAELMVPAVKLIQGLTDLPLCIDSSIIEVLDAGLAAYQGKALVNSVTAEDERLEAILPLVARYGAAVIALPNDEEEIPEDPRRAAGAGPQDHRRGDRPVRHPARGHRDRPAGHAGRRGHLAGRQDAGDDRAAARGVRGEHDARRVQRLVRHAGPARDRRGVPAHGHHGSGLTSAIMDARSPQIVRAVKAADLLLDRDAVGRGVDRRAPGPAGRPSRPQPTSTSRAARRPHAQDDAATWRVTGPGPGRPAASSPAAAGCGCPPG